MMFTKIRLVGLTTIDLPIFGARPSDTFLFKGAEGLGPPESTVTVVKGRYQGRQTQNRQIVMRVGLNPNLKQNQTAGSLRSMLYNLLATEDGEPLSVGLLNGQELVAVTKGYVSTIVPVYFSETPEVQITIDCEGPYLHDPTQQLLVPSTRGTFSVPNIGDAETGFRLEVVFTGNITSAQGWTLSRGTQSMSLAVTFQPGDILVINTIPGQRELIRYRGTVSSTLYHTLSKESVWMMLRPGPNNFSVSNTGYNWTSFKYTPRYWGV